MGINKINTKKHMKQSILQYKSNAKQDAHLANTKLININLVWLKRKRSHKISI